MTTACHSENKLSRDECLLGVFHKSLIFKDFMVRLPWESLGELIGSHVEALPLRCKAGQFFAINVLRVEDGLDADRSEFARLESNNRIYRVEKYVFKRDFIPTSPIFWAAQVQNEVLVTGVFREWVERKQLKGLQWFPLGSN